MTGVAPVVAAYGAGSPLLWWLVTAAGVVLLIVSVFLLREPAGASVAGKGADGEEATGSGTAHDGPANASDGGGGRAATPPAAPPS